MAYHYLSQISHVEVYTAEPEASVRFFEDVLGLQESHREGQSVWLRAWGEYFHHSLKLTEAEGPGLAHAAWRVDGPDDLELAAKSLADHGVEGRWIEGDVGHGKAYQFQIPSGHLFELVWDMDRYVPTPEQKSVFPGRPQRQITANAAVRRLDHVTIQVKELEADKRVLADALNFRHMDSTVVGDGKEVFITMTSGAHAHDLGVIAEPAEYSGPGGRLNHFSYYYDSREDLLRAADVLAEHGFLLEHGPHQHGIGELFYAYVFEPGGNRFELQTGPVLNYIPDWEPIRWQMEDGGNIAWQAGQFPIPGSPAPETAQRPQTLADLLGDPAQSLVGSDSA